MDPSDRDADIVTARFGSDEKRRAVVEEMVTRLRQCETALTLEELRQLGEYLFEMLFNDQIRDSFIDSYKKIQQEEAGLRLELLFRNEATVEASWPWEFLYVPNRFQISGMEPLLAISNKITLVRRAPAGRRRPRVNLTQKEKLKIGVVVASPKKWTSGPKLGAIGYDQEVTALKGLAGAGNSSTEWEVKILNPATKDTLKNFLRVFRPHILHFIGHGDILPDPDGPSLILIDDQAINFQCALPINGKDFAALLEPYSPSVIFLQSCNTGRDESQKAYSSMAACLVQVGVPIVVAMQYEIQNGAATRFAVELYKSLRAGNTIEKAVHDGRGYLYNLARDRSFGTPLIYVSTSESQLFPDLCAQTALNAVAETFFALPGLGKVEPRLAYRAYELCFNDLITAMRPLPFTGRDLSDWVDHLTNSFSIKDNSPHLLAYFVATLAERLLTAQQSLAQSMKAWLAENAVCLGTSANRLLELILDDPRQKNPPVLLLAVEPDKGNINEDDKKKHIYLFTAKNSREQGYLVSPKQPVKSGQLKPMVRQTVNAILASSRNAGELENFDDLLWIEIFLPNSDLSRLKVDQYSVDDPPIAPTELSAEDDNCLLGQRYKVVVRSLYRWINLSGFNKIWVQNWEPIKNALNNQSDKVNGKVLLAGDFGAKTKQAIKSVVANVSILGLTFEPCDNADVQPLNVLLESCVPVAVWVRKGADAAAAEACLNAIIGESPNPRYLPDLIRAERKKKDSKLREHLVLLWDDPNYGLGPQYFLRAPSEVQEEEL